MTHVPSITIHAVRRARSRSIPEEGIVAALAFGKHRAVRGADVFTLGWREVREGERLGLDLSRWESIEVVCGHDGAVITVYRNKNPKALRDRECRRRAA